MSKSNSSKHTKNMSGGGDAIAAYTSAQRPAFGAMCEQLRRLIDGALPDATSKVWHGSPVWFIDDHPVVGYSVTATAVKLLFWNGQALGEADLKPVGKHGAAEAAFGEGDAIDAKTVRGWLKKAGANVLDSKAYFQELRRKRK